MKNADTKHAAIARAAFERWPQVHERIADMRGRSLVTGIGPEPEHPRRLNQLRVGDSGFWQNIGTGDTGRDIVDLVAWLGNTDRDAAAAYLQELLGFIDASLPRSAA